MVLGLSDGLKNSLKRFIINFKIMLFGFYKFLFNNSEIVQIYINFKVFLKVLKFKVREKVFKKICKWQSKKNSSVIQNISPYNPREILRL